MENKTVRTKTFSRGNIRAALARGKQAARLGQGVPSFKCVRLIPDHPENEAHYLEQIGTDILNFEAHYAILGEVADTGHYIVLNIGTGRIVPGMLHLDRFEEVPEEDL